MSEFDYPTFLQTQIIEGRNALLAKVPVGKVVGPDLDCEMVTDEDGSLRFVWTTTMADCPDCEGTGWRWDDTACGDPEHCSPQYACQTCNPEGRDE